MSHVVTRGHEKIISMDELNHNDLTWSRFWIGLGCVLAFVIASDLVVIAIAGTHAGADYGLVVLIMTLIAGIIDGIVIARRRRHR